MIGSQKSYQGGVSLLPASTQIADNAYQYLVNGRQRFGSVEPIKKPVQLSLPADLKQGGIVIGNVTIIFVAGKAYYAIEDSDNWTQIAGFSMSATADRLYAQNVPASSFHFVRSLDANRNIHSPIVANQDFKVAGTPACIVVQDNENQPFLIIYDDVNQIFTSRVSKKYSDWTSGDGGTIADSREYVPIGNKMIFLNQKLYIVSRDGKSVYHSVTGRPLDFMVNVDENGDKLPDEQQGGAASVSFAFDFDLITCIKTINVPDSFILSSTTNMRIITCDYTNKIFGEPTYREAVPSINCGIVNQECFVENSGTYNFIDFDGVKAFDAVQQLKFKGDNSIFSVQLQRILRDDNKKPIKQRYVSCIGFDNYFLFSLDTTMGHIIAVYDELVGNWVSFDLGAAHRVKQFLTVYTETTKRCIAICQNNKVFELFASEETEVPILYVKDYVPEATTAEHKSSQVRVMFNSGTRDGVAILREIVDEQENFATDGPNAFLSLVEKELKGVVAGVDYPVRIPVRPNNKQRVNNTSFNLRDNLAGKKISFILMWTNDATLIEHQIVTSDQDADNPQSDKQLTVNNTYGS